MLKSIKEVDETHHKIDQQPKFRKQKEFYKKSFQVYFNFYFFF